MGRDQHQSGFGIIARKGGQIGVALESSERTSLEKRDARQSGHRAEDAIFGGVSENLIRQYDGSVNMLQSIRDFG